MTAVTAAIRGCLKRRFGALSWSKDAVVVLEQPSSDQPFSRRVLGGAAESFAGARSPRADERAVQHRGSGDVERLVVVPQAAGDLAVIDEPRSRSQ